MNELKKELPSRSVRRKQTPPEQTNAEEFYFLKQMAAKTPMVVILDNDEELRGWIEWYDKGAIKLNRTSGPNLLIQKHVIRYMFKEEELKVRRGPGKRDASRLRALSCPAPHPRPDPGGSAGIGPEILLKLVAADPGPPLGSRCWWPSARLWKLSGPSSPISPGTACPGWPVRRHAARSRRAACRCSIRSAPIVPSPSVSSGPADAAGAMAALDAGIALVRSGAADALVTAPVSKESIARQHLPGFMGHTDYLAEVCGLERYGRDYLMAFLAPDLQVALLNVHLPLREALDGITAEAVGKALDCLGRHAGGEIALAGLNPHAGENGLLGREDGEILAPRPPPPARAASTSTARRAPTPCSPAPAAASSTGCSPSITTRG